MKTIFFLFGGFYLKNKKENQKINFIYKEEFISNKDNLTEEEKKEIFNIKIFNLMVKREKALFGGCINDKSAL